MNVYVVKKVLYSWAESTIWTVIFMLNFEPTESWLFNTLGCSIYHMCQSVMSGQWTRLKQRLLWSHLYRLVLIQHELFDMRLESFIHFSFFYWQLNGSLIELWIVPSKRLHFGIHGAFHSSKKIEIILVIYWMTLFCFYIVFI